MDGLIALRLARRARLNLKSLVLIDPVAYGVLGEVADKDAVDFDAP
jgi:pimeloyl-ACP methyl ester carboxylesterase